jgi:hypothetical protein
MLRSKQRFASKRYTAKRVARNNYAGSSLIVAPHPQQVLDFGEKCGEAPAGVL